jgi:hypothetical protein
MYELDLLINKKNEKDKFPLVVMLHLFVVLACFKIIQSQIFLWCNFTWLWLMCFQNVEPQIFAKSNAI